MATLETGDAPAVDPVTAAGIDPITFEVLNNAFTAVVDDMGVMVEKVSFSTVTSIGKDYACCLTTPQGDVFSRGRGGLPLITGTGAARVKAVLRTIPPEDIHDGDLILHNDPFLGGTHAQDVTTVMPVFWQGELVAFVMAASHWPDVGGAVPGSFNSEADSTHGESILIPPVHIVREGVWQDAIERIVLRNVRIPNVIQGDLRGLVEACRTGRDELVKLLDKYGRDLVDREMHAVMAHTEHLLRRELSRLPDGTYTWEDRIDRDPGAQSDDPLPVALDLTIAGDHARLDFSRSSPQAIGPVNAPLSATWSAVASVLKAVFHEIPYNDGLFRAVEIVAPEGSIFNAQWPRPVSGVAAAGGEKVVSLMHGCLIQVVPERCMASPTNLVNISVHGHDERPGHGGEYVMYLWLCGGWGARPGLRDAHTHLMPLGAGTSLQPAETLERIYPVMFDAWEMKPDSEGAGRHRGGFAFHNPFHVTHGTASINCQGDRGRSSGWGFAGGEAPPHGNRLVYAPGRPEEQVVDVMSAGTRIRAGVPLDYMQGGGGGWGDPLERSPDWVVDDVRAGLVSRARARDVYGVEVVVEDEELGRYGVDEDGTRRRREELRRARPASDGDEGR
jgi:N-methylhydantoinase B